MAEFKVSVVRVDAVQKHPNADRLDVVSIGGYRCIANRHESGASRYAAGDLVVYIPEGALVPVWMLEEMGFWDEAKGKGTLSGTHGNRVKAVKLRGVLSQGLLYPVISSTAATWNEDSGDFNIGRRHAMRVLFEGSEDYIDVIEGQDVAEVLGITKWEPPIPMGMGGQVTPYHGSSLPLKFDVENIKRYPNVLRDDDMVTITEKLHGTFLQVGYDPDSNPESGFGPGGKCFIASKGLGAQGLVFKNTEENATNVYVRAAHESGILAYVISRAIRHPEMKIAVLAEIIGVQDMMYGLEKGQIRARVFDIWVDGEFECRYTLVNVCRLFGMTPVPVLTSGLWKFVRDGLEDCTNGMTHENLDISQIKEGCVIRVEPDRYSAQMGGRVILKSISEAYLLRKGGTEFN